MIIQNILNINQYKKITHIFFDLFGVLINYNKTKIILSPVNDLLCELQDKYELWIVSNTSNDQIKLLKSAYRLFNFFSGIITSETANSNKPNAKIFQYTLTTSKAIPVESIFIDDSFNNIITADSFGFNTFHYQNFSVLKSFLGY